MNTNLTSLISSNFLNDIKSQTINSHKKLESLPVSASILSPDMKMTDYIHYLSLMYDVHKNTEEVIFPVLSEFINDLEQRKKTHLIKEDFFFLDYDKKYAPTVFSAAKMTIPFALGILYVIEGSTLGGRFILKNITTIPGLDSGKGVSFFNGYGDKTGSYWKSFLNKLSEYERNYDCGDSIIAGAVYAFESIYNHFKSRERNEN